MTPQWVQMGQQSTAGSSRWCKRRCLAGGCASLVRRKSSRPPERRHPSQRGEACSKSETRPRIWPHPPLRATLGTWCSPVAYTPQTDAPPQSAPQCTELWCLNTLTRNILRFKKALTCLVNVTGINVGHTLLDNIFIIMLVMPFTVHLNLMILFPVLCSALQLMLWLELVTVWIQFQILASILPLLSEI